VAEDELSAPLGKDKKKKAKPKLPLGGPQLLAGVLGLFACAVVAWAVFGNDPLGGEPVAVVATNLPEGKAAKGDEGDGREHSRHDGPNDKAAVADQALKAQASAGPANVPAGGKTVTIIDGSSGKSQQVVIPGNEKPSAPIERKLLETTRHGEIPKIGPDGARAFALYARPRAIPQGKTDAPKIAIIVGGLGVSAQTTADAIAKLPGPVTFAFAPYGADLDKLAGNARAQNHEVLLQSPMEPFDYPDNDPGPQTLLTTLTPEQNIDRLQWQMSRMQGYVGIAGYMGARFTAGEQALAPILREISKRGLIYVDDGSSSRSIAQQVAGVHNLPFAKADVVIDSVPTPVAIDQALTRLEMLARERGTAVGFANALPGTIARLADWTKKVESRGFILVPITNVAVKAKSS
jgi:polysaccharide deacetylase 2 family uncharacterized protein YibQ